MLPRLIKRIALVVFLIVCAVIVFILEHPSAFAPVSSSRKTQATDRYIFSLTDTDHDGNVSDLEALAVMLDVSGAFDASYPSVKRYDVDSDGDVDAADAVVIGEAIDRLVS